MGGIISLYAPRRSSQHLVGETFQLDGEQLNPGTAGQREEEGRGKKQKKKKKKIEDEKMRRSEEAKEQSIHQSGLRMTRDHCLCESSQCYLRPHHRTRLYDRAEQSTLMRSKQLHAHSSAFNPLSLSLSLSTVPDNDAGCGYANPERRKNRCGANTAHILV